MPAWVFGVANSVSDPAGFGEYQNLASPTVQQYGGKLIAGGMVAEVGDGNWSPVGIVAIEFPSMDQLKTWYNSPEYQAVIDGRLTTTEGGVVFVDGG